MRRIILMMSFVLLFVQPVNALEIEAPQAPSSAQEYLPSQSTSFGDDLWHILKTAISDLQPSIAEAASVCVSLMGVTLLIATVQGFSGVAKGVSDMVGCIAMGVLMIQPVNALINLGSQTIVEISEYSRLLLPVMTAALAAQGGITTSTALYTGTALFDAILTTVVSKLLIPMLYIFLALAVANAAMSDPVLKSIRDFVKWSATWILKIILYAFTGYMSITGVISGTADASAVKAAKLTISGTVPVVGNILSDASEAILVSAGLMKNAAGVYGLLAVIAICISPFLKIGVQYLLLKLTAAVCTIFGTQQTSKLIHDFSSIMGLLLAMTGTVCLFALISTVCFMRGVS